MKPDCLYKYLDVTGALSMILNKELQFTNPIYFNDPFDCHPGLFDYNVPDGYTRGWMPKSFMQKKRFVILQMKEEEHGYAACQRDTIVC